MEQLSNNVFGSAASFAEDFPQLDTADLLRRAEFIRDALQAKSVSARQVGQLFCDLIGTCGDIYSAVTLFLSVIVPEFQADIDRRLAGADEAAAHAAAEIQRSQQTRALVEALVAQLSDQNLAAPLRVDIIDAPVVVTVNNPMPQKIAAALFPRFGIGSVLFIGDHKAVDVSPDGILRPIAIGRSTVHAVATADSSVYKSLCIEVVPPRMRISASGAIRLDSAGNIRLT